MEDGVPVSFQAWVCVHLPIIIIPTKFQVAQQNWLQGCIKKKRKSPNEQTVYNQKERLLMRTKMMFLSHIPGCIKREAAEKEALPPSGRQSGWGEEGGCARIPADWHTARMACLV